MTDKKEINYYLPITRQDIKVYSLFVLLMIIAIVGSLVFKFIEFDTASKLSNKWFLLPSIIIAIFYAYYSGVKRQTTKYLFRKILLFICLTVVFSVMLLKSFESCILIFNSYIGQQKKIQIVGVINYVKLPKREGILSTYKTEITLNNNKTLILDITGRRFEIGEKFDEAMEVGSLGIIYKQ